MPGTGVTYVCIYELSFEVEVKWTYPFNKRSTPFVQDVWKVSDKISQSQK